jgi:hypothetical protein
MRATSLPTRDALHGDQTGLSAPTVERGLRLAPIREESIEGGIEPRAVVGLHEMGKLMGDHVVETFRWVLGQMDVE